MTTFRDYLLHGWKLCHISPGFKAPTGAASRGWNELANAITDPGAGPAMRGGGLCHAYSGTCALDIDNYELAQPWLLERRIKLDELMLAIDSVHISSGRPGRAKLLFTLQAPMASLKLCAYQVPQLTGKPKTYHALELRCATAAGETVQDVLPPTLHPDTGRPYEWKYGDDLVGDWRNPPPLPAALHELWSAALQPQSQQRQLGPQAPVGAEHAEIAKLLDAQDPDTDYDTWIKWGQAVHHETKGSNEGLALWEAWSAKGGKFKGRSDLEAHWRSFRADAANAVTIGSLRREAVADVAEFPIAEPPIAASGAADPDAQAAETDARPDAVMQRLVGQNVAYVRNLDLYFDKRDRGVYQSDRAVRNSFCPDLPLFERDGKKGPETYTIDPVSWLMKSKQRRKADVQSLGMHPGRGVIYEDNGQRFANTFTLKGRICAMNEAVEPLAPTAAQFEAFQFIWSRMVSATFQSWLKKYYAFALQNPGVKIRSAPLLVSETTGTGKTTLMNSIPRLLFGHVEQLTESQVKSTFNGELLNAWWATIEEIYAGNTKAERRYIVDKLKPWITNDDLPINAKGQTAFSIPNRLQFTASSNHMDALQLEDEEERRWGVCGVREHKWTQGQGVSVYHDLLGHKDAAAVLKHIFLNESTTGFDPNGMPPVTHSKKVMVIASMGQWESTLIERMLAGEAPFDRDVFTIRDVLSQVIGLNGLTPHKLADLLKKRPFSCRMVLSGQRTTRMWAWRNYEQWRNQSERARLEYIESGKRPTGPAWSNEIPELLYGCRAEQDAEPEEIPCDLV